MLFQTPTQFAVLALLLFAGWLFGLASSSGGKKWKQRFRDEEATHKAYRTDVANDLKTRDGRVTELEAELATRDSRIAELESERDRLSHDRSIPATAAASATASSGSGSGLFGGSDHLTRIRGIDADLEHALGQRGIKTYRAIEQLTEADERALEDDLRLRPGTIDRDQWREQASLLRGGHDDDHRSRWN